ncbi:immunogenic protein P37 [Borreliella americana]|uniref:immunogenic protein P37 n=1 Tax=Borreliella americana TaxID=478807 RepID=UPI001E434C26|nr:immunogenic protein P37 [Borreliella americana]MCD2332643.1 immunogenic protein P37 [Borreliella americana]
MNLMIKVLLISSLFCSFISCKLYEKLTDKSQQTLANNNPFINDKDIADSKNINSTSELNNSSLDSIKNNNRGGRTPRGLDDAEENGRKEGNQNRNDQEQNNESNAKENVRINNLGTPQVNNNLSTNYSTVSEVDNNKPDNHRQLQQINSESREAKEARNIIHKASTSLKEAEKIAAGLEKIKSILDNMKTVTNSANSYFNTTRRNRSDTNKSKQALLLPILHQTIDKVNSSHASANSYCNDAIAASKNAKDGFEHAKKKASEALEEAIKNRSSLSYYNYLYYSWIIDANKAMESANSLLKDARKYQENLNAKMTQAIKDFEELNSIYKN